MELFDVSPEIMKKVTLGVILPFSAWAVFALLTLFVFATENTRGEFRAGLFFIPIASVLLLALSIALTIFRKSKRFYIPSWICSAACSVIYVAFAFDTEMESHM